MLRRRVWFSALDGVERGILCLASRVVEEVRNTALNVELVKILTKCARGRSQSLGRSRKTPNPGLRLIPEVEAGRLRAAWMSS